MYIPTFFIIIFIKYLDLNLFEMENKRLNQNDTENATRVRANTHNLN